MDSRTLPGNEELLLTALASGDITKIVVAIHGIGQQRRCETIRSVARRFGDDCEPAIPVLPLGYFNIADGSNVRWSRLESDDPNLRCIGFAEIYWADIPVALVRSDDTLEETKAWARTIVSRAEAIYHVQVRQYQAEGQAQLGNECFRRGIDAIDTIVEGITVLEHVCWLANKLGLFKFEIGGLLRDYVDDVQTVTEFPRYRDKILYRFHSAMNGIVAAFKGRYGRVPEIYLVAHSEGTVISLLALLQALSSMEISDPEAGVPVQCSEWIQCVKGFMTLGSPIDKHIALWPDLWKDFAFNTTALTDGGIAVSAVKSKAEPIILASRIKWRNYFDYGDPIGFRLDEAVNTLRTMDCGAFEFETGKHDFGFSRYWLPGKAHVDYWKDPEVFRHFIKTVVQAPATGPAITITEQGPPQSKPVCNVVAKWLPYGLALLLHFLAIVLLLSALSVVSLKNPHQWSTVLRYAGTLGLLLASVTVAARIPRLVRPGLRWAALAAASLAFGMAACEIFLPNPVAVAVGQAYCVLVPGTSLPPASVGKHILASAAFAVAALAWLAGFTRFIRGRKVLVASGVLVSAAIAFLGRGGLQGLTLADAAGCALFVLLWWLGIIMFDLAFVWHRYIRQSVCVRTLRAWQNHRDAEPDPYWGLGKNRRQAQIDNEQKNRTPDVARPK